MLATWGKMQRVVGCLCNKQDKRLFGDNSSRDVEKNMGLKYFRGKIAVLSDITKGGRAGA